MRKFAEACERIAGTTKKLEKIAIVADYLKSRPLPEASVAAVFLSGRPFPVWEETTLQVGGRLLWQVIEELSGKSGAELTAAYRQHGDLGAVAAEVLPEDRAVTGALNSDGLSLPAVQAEFRKIAAGRGSMAKAIFVRELISQLGALEAKYVVKIITGDLRIGLKESLVEEAIAKAYEGTAPETVAANLAAVQRANMLLGDIGQTLQLAAAGKLADAKMRLLHPLGFMLASPVESAEEGLSYFPDAAVEDKYDGIRAQAHVSAGEVKFFSRTRDEITESFPELPDVLAGLPKDAILDGEIVAWNYSESERVGRTLPSAGSGQALSATAAPAAGLGVSQPPEPASPAQPETPGPSTAERAGVNAGQARPFSVLQQRLGRKKVSEKLLREVPVAYLVFDVLYAGGELVMDRPLRERAGILDAFLAEKHLHHRGHRETQGKTGQGRLIFEDEEETVTANIIRAPIFHATSADELEELFAAAQARGNEGLMIKDLDSAYTPGKRGQSWLKMKRELATLDVVVTAVEYGHGKRVGVLSDYTFAVWNGDKLENIGKAYSGLTDVEIAEMTTWLLEHTIQDQGFRRTVEPNIVLEVAFNNMMKSERHESGYALRFPRIVRLRPDKSAEEADTIERVREIYAGQSK